MLAVVVVAVVLAVVLLLQDPLERLGGRLQDGAPPTRSRPAGRRSAGRLRALDPRGWDLAGRAERRRLARLPQLPVADRAPRTAGPAPASPRALALELARGLDELTRHLASQALERLHPEHEAAGRAAPAAAPSPPVPAQQDRRSRHPADGRRAAREDA